MRVLALVTDAYGGTGGIALYNRDFLTALCEFPDCEEVVALPRLMPNEPEPMPVKLTWVTTGLGGKGAYIKAFIRLLFSDRRFNLVVCGHLNLLPLAWLAKKIIGAPMILELYGVEAWKEDGGWLRRRFFLKGVDNCTAISNTTRDRFTAWSGMDAGKIHLLPNAIHTEWYGSGEKNTELLSRYQLHGKKVIMTLGRMSSSEQYKGFDEILNVLPDLAKIIPEIVYMLVGDGDDRPRLEEKARNLGVANRVVFPGFVEESMKPDFYRLADLYVMPSRGEGFGFVFLEALACGIPVVGSQLDGSKDALCGGLLGELVNPDDLASVQQGILKALAKPRQIPAGLEYFAWPNFVRRVARSVRELGGKNFGSAPFPTDSDPKVARDLP